VSQIDLLSYQLSEEEQFQPDDQVWIEQQRRYFKNKAAIEWWEAKRRYYRWLIQRFVDLGVWDKESGEEIPAIQEMRRYEIKRLQKGIQTIERELEKLR
jgi:hypothetical protein